MRKTITALLAAALLMGMLAGCSGSSASGEAVTVEQVSAIVNAGAVGLADRYAGVVAAGETAEVQRDQDKTILETYVEEGDMVKAGDLLFAYDTEAMQLDLDKAYLEKEKLENTIAAAQDSIAELGGGVQHHPPGAGHRHQGGGAGERGGIRPHRRPGDERG